MSGLALHAYHRLPPAFRTLAATGQGAYLRWLRYGPGSRRLVQQAREREQWSTEQWARWRTERLTEVLRWAVTRVPYYREQWAERRRQGDPASWAILANWPILEKEAVRADPRAFVAEGRASWRMSRVRTSGTTGTPLDVWRGHEAVKALYSVGMARTRGWHGVSLRDRRAMVGGQLVTPVGQRRPPFWVWDAAMHQLYMSSYHLAPDLTPFYLEALRRHRITYLAGYTSSLYALAQAALDQGRRDLQMRVAITSAEPLYDYQREVIAEAFQCPVRETYGMVELVAAASECEAGHLHLWPEVGWVEVVEGTEPVLSGTTGDLVCTGLLNLDMPLIRYRVGDRGALPADDSACPCGRTLPRLAAVEGRQDDVLVTPDGRRIGRLSQVVKGLPVREAQIVQEALGRIHVRFVPVSGFTSDTGALLRERVRERMGDVEVVLDEVTRVPRTANGKFRSVICRLPVTQRPATGRNGVAGPGER